MSDQHSTRTYHTAFECENCGAEIAATFTDPAESFDATCSDCRAHYPEVYV